MGVLFGFPLCRERLELILIQVDIKLIGKLNTIEDIEEFELDSDKVGISEPILLALLPTRADTQITVFLFIYLNFCNDKGCMCNFIF